MQGYHLPPVSFTVEEAVQLLLGADLASGLGTGEQRDAVRAAAAKVEAVLRPETRAEVERLRERIRVSHWMHRGTSPWLVHLQQGVIQDRVLWLRYHAFGSDEVTERKVEPYTLVFYGGDWHLVGYCRLRESVRDFRADRIREAELLDEHFQRPVGLFERGRWQARPRSGDPRLDRGRGRTLGAGDAAVRLSARGSSRRAALSSSSSAGSCAG